mmetsp:Transcript_56930/g.169861  ORF Transcript_56930/g.169861 Transcript_56930/m.169861 type:complete len:377 (-) Transcript_56930:69-1199(-)
MSVHHYQHQLGQCPSDNVSAQEVRKETSSATSIGDSDAFPKKSLRFSPVTRIAYVHHLSEVSDYVLNAMYNTPEEARRIELGMVASIRAYRAGRLSRDGSETSSWSKEEEKEDTIRGLEHMCSAGELRRRKAIKERATEAVLGEQSRQRALATAASDDGEEALARAYAPASVEARDIALQNGHGDAAYVRLRVAPPPARPARRPILKKKKQVVSKNVLARLTAATAFDRDISSPLSSEAGRSLHASEATELFSVLDRALDINTSGSSSSMQQKIRNPQGRRSVGSSSKNSSLWASLSREAVFPASTTSDIPPPPPLGGFPPKLARDVLERISLTLRDEKDAALPVAVPLMPLPSIPSQPSSPDALMGMLAQTTQMG